MMRVDFEPTETEPAGDWSVFAKAVTISGEERRLDDCRAFVNGIAAARKSRSPFGVRLVREPPGPQGRPAIRVVGFWAEAGMLSPEQERHIGYVPRPLALRIGDKPVAARLVGLEAADMTLIDVIIDILEAAS